MSTLSNKLAALTKEEQTLLLESLIFSASGDICADWSEEHMNKFAKLALKLDAIDHQLPHLYVVHEKNDFEGKHTHELVQHYSIRQDI